MIFKEATRSLNRLLKKEKPNKFSSSWILYRNPDIYRFIVKNVRVETGGIDWDKVVSSLDRRYQKRWFPIHYRPNLKLLKFYRDSKEVEITLRQYKSKLYIFAVAMDETDHLLRNTISIALVRVAQKGNKRAEEKLLFFLDQIIQIWVEKYPCLYRWAGQREELDKKIRHCIYHYRFTGSFLGYLFKTLEYSARALNSFQAYSLDSYIPGTTMTMNDTLTKDPETGQIVRGTQLRSFDFH